ncbi:hypothetical protein [Gloeocapsopsis dulcis]|uniref:Uncharacterized protein n=1 Tax=Gloeocapsopsis dulcis AAB1 = 1H9 TaxID=1433147 RepID=A0A6N8FW44_9CHRO|nr:hypothetical protein [Gloeocapsopsis dulcis]MUL37171.1 hypothetical protein [Gloeocapsopsis dulcis AAB1 = 1H9]WNN90223.1 hypothetical protein P0S91_03740 [Gloeocapsopsis dulcis]
MNSSVNPFSESSNTAFDSVSTESQAEIGGESSTVTDAVETSINRQQPIPPPSEPMQYRAIGLVRSRYVPSAEQFTKGVLLTSEGIEIDAVLLGRIMSLVRNHLDLSQEHLWVVYPRTQQKEDTLHLQVVGVWEPDKLAKQSQNQGFEIGEQEDDSVSEATRTLELVEDGYFSVRGEIVYQSAPDQHFIVKIKQAPRKDSDKPKYFKLKLTGDLGSKAVGQFWDLHAQRQEKDLVLKEGSAIAVLPSKPKLRRGGPRKGGYPLPRRNSETPRPVRKSLDPKPIARPVPKASVPKPIKRPKPPN